MTTLYYTSNGFNNRMHHHAVTIPCRAPHAVRRSPVLSREELQSLILEMVG